MPWGRVMPWGAGEAVATGGRSGRVPLPKVMTVAEVHERFGTEEACLSHLRKLRWGEDLERFVCPGRRPNGKPCGHTKGG
ncbi:MAG: hypothetical protein BroJett003_05640 [Planctomycetota bacterium]|nr:MAG: hypothetical protein BroJett003_05640 [Planctomycetota bacterium]